MNSKLTTLLTISFSVLTINVCQAEPGSWLIGAFGGYGNRTSSVNATTTYNNPNITFAGIPPTTVIEDYDDSGLGWGLFAGYQAQCENWILGGELSFSWENMGEDHPFAYSDVAAMNGENGLGWNGSFHYERRNIITLIGRMGYELESLEYFIPPVFIPYILAGVELSHDKLEATYSGNPPYPFASVSSSNKRWPYRFVIGAGTEFPLKDSGAAIRFEYIYHSSGQTVETSSVILDGGIVTPSFVTAMDPIIQSGKIALVWYFN